MTTEQQIKLQLTKKSFFCRLNKSLYMLEMHCTFLPLKVTKSGHHLLHDRASKGYGSIPGLKSPTSLHACLQRLTTMQIRL